ncbi:glutathione S-transferase omega-1 [Aplysia californica]|uniref:Glutathione S-transferase omega n=1 Tax=Aplysia californica TaxID=6500 RepID=A0ABM0JBN5_APLCA|nr:glutathione S-transferase omega-1 [Aplysia californica]
MSLTQKSFAAGSTMPPVTPGRLRLYNMRFCPFAQRTRLVLEHKNIPYETVNINLKSKPDWFLERNPLGLVPVLELDDKIIYESTATCDWLDDVYPENKLQPTDAYTKAWDRILLEYFSKITSNVYALRTATDKTKHLELIHKAYAYYENILAQRGGPFFGGAKPAMIDLLMWPHMERVVALMSKTEPDAIVDRVKYPNFGAKWYDSMYSLPAVKATMFDEASHLRFFKSYMEGNPDYDFGLEE